MSPLVFSDSGHKLTLSVILRILTFNISNRGSFSDSEQYFACRGEPADF